MTSVPSQMRRIHKYAQRGYTWPSLQSETVGVFTVTQDSAAFQDAHVANKLHDGNYSQVFLSKPRLTGTFTVTQ